MVFFLYREGSHVCDLLTFIFSQFLCSKRRNSFWIFKIPRLQSQLELIMPHIIFIITILLSFEYLQQKVKHCYSVRHWTQPGIWHYTKLSSVGTPNIRGITPNITPHYVGLSVRFKGRLSSQKNPNTTTTTVTITPPPPLLSPPPTVWWWRQWWWCLGCGGVGVMVAGVVAKLLVVRAAMVMVNTTAAIIAGANYATLGNTSWNRNIHFSFYFHYNNSLKF